MVAGFDVFVSYGHADQPWVRVLAENLERAGLRVFYDEWEIGPGDVLAHRLDAGIRTSTSGILVVSPHALSRPWVKEEYAAMLSRVVAGRQRLIPVLLKNADLPPFLTSRVWVDFSQVADEDGYWARVGELVAELRGRRRTRPTADGSLQPPPGLVTRPESPRTATLRITPNAVTLTTADGTAGGRPAGLDWSAGQKLLELERVRTRRSATGGLPAKASPTATTADPVDSALRDVGRMLGERFLPAGVAAALAAEVDAAVRAGAPLRLAVDVADDAGTATDTGLGLADLPWETLTLPGKRRPLVLHPRVELHRAVGGLGPTPAMKIHGPLRILAVIASPERGGELLDYEAELARILDAVADARRQGEAYVRILSWGSRAAIRAALHDRKTRFHVLHLSCHARPGLLVLEKENGDADPLDAKTFAEKVLVAGRGVPLVVLSGCSTALPGTATDHDPDDGSDEDGQRLLPGLARGLLAHGVPAVVAMTARVTDLYTTELTSRFYAELAGRQLSEPLAALADARRAVEDERAGMPASDRRAGRAEWATPALFLRGPSIPLFDPTAKFEKIDDPPEPVLADGIAVRRVGEFVGRRADMRTLLRVLRGERAGVVIHGLGGVGKSTLAAELVTALGSEAGLVVSLSGPVAVDQILTTIAKRLWEWCIAHNIDKDDVCRRLVGELRTGQTPWADRMGLLAGELLPRLPVTLLLDNAEDNLAPDGPGAGQAFLDDQLCTFLASWVALPRQAKAKLLVTSRFPLPVDAATARRLAVHHLGALSPAETRKLLWRLPALNDLTPDEQTRAIADVGGHPLTLEYLDALLTDGRTRFHDVAAKLEHALHDRGINNPAAWYKTVNGDLDIALAETVTLAVDDIVLDGLLARLDSVPLARRLLAGASTYRLPVDRTGLAWQVSQVAERSADPDTDPQIAENPFGHAREHGAATPGHAEAHAQQHPPLVIPDLFDHAVATLLALGLLTPGTGDQDSFTVHRWTATAILRRTNPDQVNDAHRRAAAYWQWRVKVGPQERLDDDTQLTARFIIQFVAQVVEAGHHQLAAGDPEGLMSTTYVACLQLQVWGLWDWEERICRQTLLHLPPTSRQAAHFTHELGNIASRRGDYTAAEDHYSKTLTVFEELGDRASAARARHNLGNIALQRGDYAAAEDHYSKALTTLEELGDRTDIGRIYIQLGAIAHKLRYYRAAEDRYNQALGIAEERGDRAGIAYAHHHLSAVAFRRLDFSAAEEHCHRALAAFADLAAGEPTRIADVYSQLGAIAYARGDSQAAEESINEALAIFERHGDRANVSRSYHELGNIACQRNAYPVAEKYTLQALAIAEELGKREGINRIYGQLGMIARERGDFQAAGEYCRQALAAAQEFGNQAGIASGFAALGGLYAEQGQEAEAARWIARSLGILVQYGLLGTLEATEGIIRLALLRETLDDEALHAILAQHLSRDDIAFIVSLLDVLGSITAGRSAEDVRSALRGLLDSPAAADSRETEPSA
ncbi:tetratricopeptide repeat protein [Frankia sp. Cj5]|uniref:tetratricopeptide repeat protein n=1 Tax=Frankia sp. Cj5 TaxID=2880978 RepID=UPI001EF5E085|nr:tetratricopeptide repeat protein [Frankia sp. Cj5]